MRVLQLGWGANLAKMAIKQAYQNIPAHPARHEMGSTNIPGHNTTVRATLSPPDIFSMADALEWIMKQQGASWLAHYVDNFITVG